MLGRRRVLGMAAGLVAALLLGEASAGIARPIALPELVRSSRHSALVLPLDAVSRWEQVGASRRIVTYTRLRVERSLSGPAATELWVRTLGGRVGKIGQIVEGEAELALGARAVVFLAPGDDGVLNVTAFAQGHYPLRTDGAGTERLLKSPRLSVLIGNEASAVRDLAGKPLGDAIDLVRRAGR